MIGKGYKIVKKESESLFWPLINLSLEFDFETWNVTYTYSICQPSEMIPNLIWLP